MALVAPSDAAESVIDRVTRNRLIGYVILLSTLLSAPTLWLVLYWGM